ncbi:MAG: tryptophan-rich sensory protein [Clostridiales bacterium]|nr:tryptophan-rich sensory protein [Clostridiales bacterium]
MSFIKSNKRSVKRRISSIVRSELCRIDMKCVIAGAVVILLCGIISAIAGGSAKAYCELKLPKGAPFAFIFPIIWTVMYILIGGSAGAVACSRERALEADKFKGLLFFTIMMIFNFVWYPLFFGAGAYFAAFAAIIMMLILTFFIICFFSRIYLITAAIMSVYLIWIFYCAYLNLAVIILN